jgi:hypothetical protein
MAVQKLSASQLRQANDIEQLQRIVARARATVAELDSNRAAKMVTINNLSGMIARELSQMRQRLLTAPIGTVADLCGSLSIMASRSGGISMKIRGLIDGLNSIDMQLELALKQARVPDAPKPKPQDDPTAP